MFNKYISFFLALFIVGCVNIDNIDSLIKKGNWVVVGERDGARGLPSRSLTELDVLADAAGVQKVDIISYEDGYNTGIEKFCDVGNAYSIGLSGMQYFGVCSYKSDGLRFRMEWQRGFDHFQAGDGSF